MLDPRIWPGLGLTCIEASICSISRNKAQGRRRIEGRPDQGDAIGPVIPEEILDRLPDEVRGVVAEAAAFSGPLPPPTMFGQYDQVLLGGAGRIMQMAESEQSHRIDWENKCLEISGGEVARGQWMGFAVSILCIGGTIWLAHVGHEWPAVVLGGASAANLVGRFLGQRSSSNRDSRSETPKSRKA